MRRHVSRLESKLILKWAQYLPIAAIPLLTETQVIFEGNHEVIRKGIRLKSLPILGMSVVVPVELIVATKRFYSTKSRLRKIRSTDQRLLIFPNTTEREILSILNTKFC